MSIRDLSHSFLTCIYTCSSYLHEALTVPAAWTNQSVQRDASSDGPAVVAVRDTIVARRGVDVHVHVHSRFPKKIKRRPPSPTMHINACQHAVNTSSDHWHTRIPVASFATSPTTRSCPKSYTRTPLCTTAVLTFTSTSWTLNATIFPRGIWYALDCQLSSRATV